jgi:hypothetical protein
MKIFIALMYCLVIVHGAIGQQIVPTEKQRQALSALIDNYSTARENRDTVLLKNILTQDIDQLVSTGEWRNGIAASVDGMLRSSTSTPGSRSLIVDKIKLLSSSGAIVDCRYEIKNPDGTTRKMWSTFITVLTAGTWKITSIRNMLPSQ